MKQILFLVITNIQFHYLKLKYFNKIFSLTIKECKNFDSYSIKNRNKIIHFVEKEFYSNEEVVKYISKLNETRKKYDISEINLSEIIVYNQEIIL